MRGSVEEPIILAQAVTTDTTLSGKVTIQEDLLVPEGVTLSFLPGTEVTVTPSEGTRTESQFVTTETEVVVRGSLRLEGTSIRTGSKARGSWGGIISSTPEAMVTLKDSIISDAQYGLMMLGGNAQVKDCTFENNETGIAAALGAWVGLAGNTYRNNTIATAAWHTVSPLKSPTDIFINNDDDALAFAVEPSDISHRDLLPIIPDALPVTREYLGEVALTEDTIWTGTVVIDGQIVVLQEVTLTIEPGTRVLFSFRDTNGDGLGESWIIAMGTVKVLGEEDAWVLFDSEDDTAKPGSWDSLSIIASDSMENVISHTVFRRGVKAFHNHFSRARLDNVVFEDNLRGIQFQESEGTVIDGALLMRNQSGARFRDSEVTLRNIVAADNIAGINFLRSKVTASDLVITGSFAESFVSRESETALTRAYITGNVRGPRFKGEGENISIRESIVSGNLTEGISFNNVKGTVRESSFTENGFTGLSVTDAEVTAFRNRITGNGRFEVDNNGSTVVDARGNDWGHGSVPDQKVIYDGQDESGIGIVLVDNPERFILLFPGMDAPADDIGGELLIVGDVTTAPQRDIIIEPGTYVKFAVIEQDSLFDLCSDHPSFPRSELKILGRIFAEGTADDQIYFYQMGPASVEGAFWGSVNLANSRGGRFENCVFTNAVTGVHAREAGDVSVKSCVFERNQVGLRFSSTNMAASDNLFRFNDVGIRFHEFGGIVEKNSFERNNSAIFVTDNPENITIRNNTFRNSRDYHIKLGLHVTEDVEIGGGSMEIPEGKTLGEMVFDEEDDGDLGRVIVLP